jgi:hypothetical protein
MIVKSNIKIAPSQTERKISSGAAATTSTLGRERASTSVTVPTRGDSQGHHEPLLNPFDHHPYAHSHHRYQPRSY